MKSAENSSQHMFFTYINISFFNPFSDPFPIIVKEVTQIRNNTVCVVAHNISVLCCALTTDRCSVFQHSFKYQEKSEFYGPNFLNMFFLVTVKKLINNLV